MIDLHLHTTASDGRMAPAELVDEAACAGLSVMAVTDHDTVAAVDEVRALAAARGIEAVPGIEVTAVHEGRDVHLLGYFIDAADRAFAAFLAHQRRARIDRARRMASRLAGLGLPIDIERLLAARQERPVGRPQIAQAMMAAGYVADLAQAFDDWLAEGRPAFVPRAGADPPGVIEAIHRAGGLASLAHPGRTNVDAHIEAWCTAGLDALEAYHPDHDAETRVRYARLAERLGLLVTGGSDYHADPGRAVEPGCATLPPADWERLSAARARHSVVRQRAP